MVRRLILIFGPDPKLFYGTLSRKTFIIINVLFLPSNVVFDVGIGIKG